MLSFSASSNYCDIDLGPYKPYVVSVAAFTGEGRGPIVASDEFFTEEGGRNLIPATDAF